MEVVDQVLRAEEWQRVGGASREPETMLHCVCDFICGRLGASERLQAYKHPIAGIPSEVYLEKCKEVVRDLCCNHEEISNLDPPLAEVIDQRRIEVRHAVIQQTVALSKCFLKDFDWSLKIVLGSDDIAKIQIPIFVLSLRLQKGEGKEEEETVTLELDQNELGMVLAQLEKPLSVARKNETIGGENE